MSQVPLDDIAGLNAALSRDIQEFLLQNGVPDQDRVGASVQLLLTLSVHYTVLYQEKVMQRDVDEQMKRAIFEQFSKFIQVTLDGIPS